MSKNKEVNHKEVQSFYDDIYYANINESKPVSKHLTHLAKKVGFNVNDRVLDIACGTGQWLLAASKYSVLLSGIDISDKAIEACRNKLPGGSFSQGCAESLPYEDSYFDFVSCLGALEHFIDPERALQEMHRVGTSEARYLLLVPNSEFLTAKLGLYKGTGQKDIKEELRSIEEWGRLFENSGLTVDRIWKDLHICSWTWIRQRSAAAIFPRAIQALMLPLWPLRWQYQVYFLCHKN